MVLRAGLVLVQSFAVLMITQKAEVKPFASSGWSGYRRTAHHQFLVDHTRQVFQFLQFRQELRGDFFRSIFAKFEENCTKYE